MNMTGFSDDGYCFVCGNKNPVGLKLNFTFDGKTIKTEYTPSKEHQGYMNIVHGGLVTALLDEVMVKVAIELGKPAVTARMDVRLKKAVNIGTTIIISAEITKETRKTLDAYASAKVDNETVADARGKLIKIELDRDSRNQEAGDSN
jgi:acyl-coenzyme A thioesterase PaaI-like protein